MVSSPAVQLENVSKQFGSTNAVDGISLEIGYSEIFTIIGPNGAGKTTTVNMICGMFSPTSGNVRTLGMDPMAEERRLREVLGVQFQEARLPGALKVREALELYSSFYKNPRDWRALAEEWGIVGKLDTRFERLSGGQKQRLFICLALLNTPKLVVLDELTTGLDPNARRQSWELVKQIRDNGTTVLLVTHSMDEAEYLADRIALVNDGKIAAIGTPEELTRSTGEKRIVTFTAPGFDPHLLERFGQVQITHDLVQVEGTAFLMADVANALREAGIDPPDLRTEHTSLDDLFIAMTGDAHMEEN